MSLGSAARIPLRCSLPPPRPVPLRGPPVSYLPDPCAVPCSASCRRGLGLGLASWLLRGPTARLARLGCCRQEIWAQPPKTERLRYPGCPPPRLCAPLAPALTHPVALRHSHPRRSPGPSAPRTRAHTHQGPQPAAGKPSPSLPEAPKHLILGTRARTPGHPTPSSRSPSVYSLCLGVSSLSLTLQLCAVPLPHYSPHPTLWTIGSSNCHTLLGLRFSL